MDAPAFAARRWRVSLGEDVRVTDGGGGDMTPRSRKMRAVIAILVVTPGHMITRDALIALLWSCRGTEQARASLRQCLFMLRTEVPALAEADSNKVWLVAANVDLSGVDLAPATLSQLGGLDPAFDGWLTAHGMLAAAGAREMVQTVPENSTGPARRWRIWPAALIGGAIALALIVASWPLHRSTAAAQALPVIVIVPFDALPHTPAADAVAARMSDDIRALLPADRAVVRASDLAGNRLQEASRLGAEWVISGSVEARDGAGKVHIRIETLDGRLIWGRDVDAAPGRLADAAAVAATRMAMAAGCALAGPRVRRNADVLGLLFAACERLDFSADNYSHQEALVTLRRLADRAPDDALAQAYFGTGLAVLSDDMPPDLAKRLRVEAVQRLDRAIRLDARVGVAWIGRFALIRGDQEFALKESLLARGLAADPDNPMLNSFMGSQLFAVGRAEEGLLFAQRAAALAPAYLAPTQNVAAMLSAVGRPREALAWLDLADRRFPRNARQARQRLDVLIASGDTSAARALLDQARDVPGFIEPSEEAESRRLTYAIDAPRGALAAAVAREAVAAAAAKPELASKAFGVLVDLGRYAEAFELAGRYPLPSDAFFEFRSRPILLDPGFPVIAGRAGLWDYWQRTRHWPDVCRDPQLKWRCGASIKSASNSG
jgi:tetratricopeptide (TPR) repeat protein